MLRVVVTLLFVLGAGGAVAAYFIDRSDRERSQREADAYYSEAPVSAADLDGFRARILAKQNTVKADDASIVASLQAGPPVVTASPCREKMPGQLRIVERKDLATTHNWAVEARINATTDWNDPNSIAKSFDDDLKRPVVGAKLFSDMKHRLDTSFELVDIVVVLADEYAAPVPHGRTFDGGYVRGTAYYFSSDRTTHKVICVATVAVRSSETIFSASGESLTQTKVDEDLRNRVYVEVGPKLLAVR